MTSPTGSSIGSRLTLAVAFCVFALGGPTQGDGQRSGNTDSGVIFSSDKLVSSSCFVNKDQVAVCAFDGSTWVVGLRNGSVTPGPALAFEPVKLLRHPAASGKVIAVGRDQMAIIDWLKKPTIANLQLPFGRAATAAVMNRDTLVVGCTDGFIRVIRLGDAHVLWYVRPAFRSRHPRIRSVAASPDEQFIAASFSNVMDENDKQVFVWDKANKRVVFEYKGSDRIMGPIALRPCPPIKLVFQGPRFTLMARTVTAKNADIREVGRLGSYLLDSSYSHDGKSLATVSADGAVTLLREGRLRRLKTLVGSEVIIHSIGISPDNRTAIIHYYSVPKKASTIFMIRLPA